MELLAVVVSFLFLYIVIRVVREADRQEDYWHRVIEDGLDFLDTLKERKVKVDEVGQLEPSRRKKVIQHLGYDPKRIEEFFVLVDEFPEADLMNLRRSRPVYKGVPIWQGYRITRQSLRRWPGYHSRSAGVRRFNRRK